MKIYLLDKNEAVVRAWENEFSGCEDVEIINAYLHRFLTTHDVECIVSPANAYGLMDGGYDLAITDFFGPKLPKAVQQKILKEWKGEQVVGTSLWVDIPDTDMKLIHTPTMRVPSIIKDPMVVYHCMRSTLLLAMKKKVKSILIPAFGGACGGLRPHVIASLMRKAYDQVNNPPEELDWCYAEREDLEEIE